MVATHIFFDFHLPKFGVSWSKLTSIFFRWVDSTTKRQEIRWTYMMFFRILFFEKRHSYILAIWEELWCWEHVDDVEMDWCSCFSYMEVQHMTVKGTFLIAQRCRIRFGLFELLKLSSQLAAETGWNHWVSAMPRLTGRKPIWTTLQRYHKFPT